MRVAVAAAAVAISEYRRFVSTTRFAVCLLLLLLAAALPTVAQRGQQGVPIAPAVTGSEGPHAYFDALVARRDCKRALSLRPQPDVTWTGDRRLIDCSAPHLTLQLN